MDGSEGEGSASHVARRNAKRPAMRKPHSVDDDTEENDDQVAAKFCLVKWKRRKMFPAQGEVGTTSAAANNEIGPEGPAVDAENVERPSQAGRLRASPGRLVKLNKALTPSQKSNQAL